MAKYPGLVRHPRTGMYWFRRTVPEPYRAIIGEREITETLGTKDETLARERYFAVARRAHDKIEEARSGKHPVREEGELRLLASEWFEWAFPKLKRDFTREIEADLSYDPVSNELQDQMVEHIADEDDLDRLLLDFIAEKGLKIGKRDDDFRRLHQEAMWKYLEEYPPRRQFKMRSEIEFGQSAPLASSAESDLSDNLPISVIFEKWAAERKPNEKTLSDWSMATRRFREVVGFDIGVRSITKAQCRDYKDTLLKLPNRLTSEQKKLGVLKVIEQTTNEVPRLSAKAVNKLIAAVHSILEYATANDYAATNPMKGVKAIETDNGEDSRLPYMPSHLTAIFASDLFAKAPRVPEERNADFWLPLLGLFTGARLEEIGAASLDDVKNEGGISYLHITTIEGRRLKTQTSKRRVPLHDEIIRCGLLAYVEALKKHGETKMFPDIRRKPGAKGAQTAAWSKKYGRWLDKIGITDSRLVFHSFRHTFKEACRVADIREEIHDALTGHSNGSIGRQYGGYPLVHLAENVGKIRYAVNLKHLYC